MITLSLDILDSGGNIKVVVKDQADAIRMEAYVKDANKALENWIEDIEDGIQGERTTV